MFLWGEMMSIKKDIEKEKDNLEENEDLQDENMDESLDIALSKKEEELEEVKTKLLRLQADFINYKKRTEKEKDSLVNYGIESIACELLPVLDNFERAMESERDKEDGFYQGIAMIQKQLIEVLHNNGVKEIESLNKPFDPNYHHAVIMEESDDWEEGIILDVLQKGYMLNDKVIRPSMVRVAK